MKREKTTLQKIMLPWDGKVKFSIHFLDGRESDDLTMDKGDAEFARVQIGNFSEQILVPLGYWSRKDYSRQWQAAINSLLMGDAKTALITEMYDPSKVSYLRCWSLYRGKDKVYIQEQMLFLDKQFPKSFQPKEVGQYISDCKTTNAEGDKISEWVISARDLEEWLTLLKNQDTH